MKKGRKIALWLICLMVFGSVVYDLLGLKLGAKKGSPLLARNGKPFSTTSEDVCENCSHPLRIHTRDSVVGEDSGCSFYDVVTARYCLCEVEQ